MRAVKSFDVPDSEFYIVIDCVCIVIFLFSAVTLITHYFHSHRQIRLTTQRMAARTILKTGWMWPG